MRWYPPNVGAQSAVHIHITDKEYNTQYMLIADTFTVHPYRSAGIRLSRQCGIYTPHQHRWCLDLSRGQAPLILYLRGDDRLAGKEFIERERGEKENRQKKKKKKKKRRRKKIKHKQVWIDVILNEFWTFPEYNYF